MNVPGGCRANGCNTSTTSGLRTVTCLLMLTCACFSNQPRNTQMTHAKYLDSIIRLATMLVRLEPFLVSHLNVLMCRTWSVDTVFLVVINTAFQILVGVQMELASHRIGPSSPALRSPRDDCCGSTWTRTLRSGAQVKDTGEQSKALRGGGATADRSREGPRLLRGAGRTVVLDSFQLSLLVAIQGSCWAHSHQG